MDFGEIIRLLRESSNLTRRELAAYLSRSVSFVRRMEIERNSAPPKADVRKLSRLFELDFKGL